MGVVDILVCFQFFFFAEYSSVISIVHVVPSVTTDWYKTEYNIDWPFSWLKKCMPIVSHFISILLTTFNCSRGWGVMTLDDIPQGGFVSVYNGLICNGKTGDKRGMVFGDEYLTELDYIGLYRTVKMKRKILRYFYFSVCFRGIGTIEGRIWR